MNASQRDRRGRADAGLVLIVLIVWLLSRRTDLPSLLVLLLGVSGVLAIAWARRRE